MLKSLGLLLILYIFFGGSLGEFLGYAQGLVFLIFEIIFSLTMLRLVAIIVVFVIVRWIFKSIFR